MESGATNLQAKLGAHIASFGDQCWQSDSTVRAAPNMKRWDGREYHRESIGRARRQMARVGWIRSARVFPQQIPTGAKFPSTHGTTTKHIDWKNLGVRNPLTRGERRQQRQKQKHVDRPRTEQGERVESPRRHAALEPHFVALVAGIGSMPVPSTRAPHRTQRPVDRERRQAVDLEGRAAEARRSLEDWARANEERGPP